jgi:phosphoglycerate dehydrogenase-like enzyme
MKVAVLDDYQNVALKLADWTAVSRRAEITVFNDHVTERAVLVQRLADFDVLCVMRERTPLPREVIEQLPRLKLIVSTGARNISIDAEAAKERGIPIKNTGYSSTAAIELTWALILGSARQLRRESDSVRKGGWQTSIGIGLTGNVLGVVGLGSIGSEVARIGLAFGMKVIAWSENLTSQRAGSVGASLVEKSELFRQADIVTIHLISSRRTRGLIGAADLGLMKPTAIFVNTSRGEIVDEDALIRVLESKAILGAAVDVFSEEPLPSRHPFRALDNVLATPHIGFVTDDLYRTFYRDVVTNIATWLDSQPPSLD